MRNIYDILNERQEYMLDMEYEGIQEGYDEVILLDKTICVTLEELVYNNPEKKKLSVLMEEVEANESNKVNNIINKLKEQMQKVLQWLTNMFKHYEKVFAEGADFVKNNDLNQYMNRLKSKNIQDTVNYHPFKSPFKHMKTICMRGIKIDNFITKRAHNGANDATGEWADDNLSSGDKTENYLEGLLKKFKFDKDNLKEMSLTKVNVILIMNNLSQLPEANKELERMKSKVQRMYNGAINDIRQKANTNNDKKALNTGNELSFVNSQLKKINERIRAYSKIMTMVFKEDYNLAKLIVSKAS